MEWCHRNGAIGYNNTMRFWFFCAVLATASGFAQAQQQKARTRAPARFEWKASPSLIYAQGQFETGQTNRLTQIPLEFRRYLNKGNVSVAASFISLETTGETAPVNGRLRQLRRSYAKAMAPGGATTNSGLGDIDVSGRYYLVDEAAGAPAIDLMMAIKLPTADESKGLGTGEFDVGFGLEMSKWLDSRYAFYLDWSYLLAGDPEDVNLNNQIAYDIGAGVKVFPKFLASVFYEEATPLLGETSSSRSLALRGNYRLDRARRLLGGLSLGLSSGAPDFSLTAGASFGF